MFNLHRDWLPLLLALAPFAILAAVWNMFPASIPMHFGIDGQPDRYSTSRAELFLLPSIGLFIFILISVLPQLDPKKPKFSENTLQMLKIGIMTFFLLLFGIITYVQIMGDFSLNGKPLFSVILLLLMFLGNLFGKLRPNYFIGIRTPWTLESENSWRKTHQLAGKLWVFGSLLMLGVCWVLPMDVFTFVFIGFVLLISLIPVAASWKYAQKTNQ